MKKYTLLLTLLVGLSLSFPLMAAMPEGSKITAVSLDGKTGAKVTDGGAWSSDTMQGTFHLFFYVDPDEKDLNEKAADQFKATAKDYSKYKSIAMINMAATWKPDFAIRSKLKDKQKKFPKTLYLMDYKKVMVDKWELEDDSYSINAIAPDGTVLFSKGGKLSDADIAEVIALIQQYAPVVEAASVEAASVEAASVEAPAATTTE